MSDRSEREVAFLLVVLQAGIGLLAAFGTGVVAMTGFTGNWLLTLLAAALSITLLVLAGLLLRGSRRACTWLAAYEALGLFGANLAAAVHLGPDLHVAAVVTNLGLPTLLLVLVLRLRQSRLYLPSPSFPDTRGGRTSTSTASTADSEEDNVAVLDPVLPAFHT